MNIAQARCALCDKTYCFIGRTSRSEFWWGYLLLNLATVLLLLFVFALPVTVLNDSHIYTMANFWGVVSLICIGAYYLLQMMALFARRLHDLDQSAWFVILMFVPLGNLILVIMCMLPGTYGDNSYGPDPEEVVGNIRKKPTKSKRYQVDVSYTVEKSEEHSTSGRLTHVDETVERKASISFPNRKPLQADLSKVSHEPSNLVHFIVSKDLRSGQLYVSEMSYNSLSPEELADSTFWDLSTRSKKMFVGLILDLQELVSMSKGTDGSNQYGADQKAYDPEPNSVSDELDNLSQPDSSYQDSVQSCKEDMSSNVQRPETVLSSDAMSFAELKEKFAKR